MAEDALPAIPAAWVTAGIEGAIAHHKRQRDAYWNCPSSGEAAAIIAGAMPLIVTAERERAEAKLAEVRQVITTFRAHYGGVLPVEAQDLAEAVRQVLDRREIGGEAADAARCAAEPAP